ncbi:hypothetical protein BGX27_001553 [Mortierella sp. AM989]|nr:hypothetical protein BGX27_001553 [Mortierella sp. AM989]
MMEQFPPNREFGIRLRDTNFVLDVNNSGTEPGTTIILWNARDEDNDNQKWICENKNIVRNKKTGLVLSVPGLTPNVQFDTQDVTGEENQRFEYYDYTISAQTNDNLVLGVAGTAVEGGRVSLIERNNDSKLQQWEII